MNKQTIITCLRGTIGRWPKGKVIVIPVLALVAMAGQAQTFTHSKDVGMGACIKKKKISSVSFCFHSINQSGSI